MGDSCEEPGPAADLLTQPGRSRLWGTGAWAEMSPQSRTDRQTDRNMDTSKVRSHAQTRKHTHTDLRGA